MWEKRYQAVLRRIGSAQLLNLPEPVKNILKATTDLKTKVRMLECIEKYIH